MLLIIAPQYNCCFPYHPRFRYRSNEEEVGGYGNLSQLFRNVIACFGVIIEGFGRNTIATKQNLTCVRSIIKALKSLPRCIKIVIKSKVVLMQTFLWS
jgi:hypothetical protein